MLIGGFLVWVGLIRPQRQLELDSWAFDAARGGGLVVMMLVLVAVGPLWPSLPEGLTLQAKVETLRREVQMMRSRLEG